MQPSTWPEWMKEIWAKSPARGAGRPAESLAEHTWLVLMRLAGFIQLRPELPQRLQTPRLWHILFWAATLHDFGKASAGFQKRLRRGVKWPHRHEVLSLAFVDWITSAFAEPELPWLIAAIASHHKDAVEIQLLYPPPDDLDDDLPPLPMDEFDPQTIQHLWRWLSDCIPTWVHDLGLSWADISTPHLPAQAEAVQMVRESGATRIYHWLDIYRRFVHQIKRSEESSLIVGALTLRGYLINADHGASAHAGALPRLTFDAEAVLRGSEIRRSNLYNHQIQAASTDGSALLSAPTGSGKTEAALLWAVRQSTVGKGSPRLFYTLPYQASINAMQLRLESVFGQHYVGLQHGRSLLALYRLLMAKVDHPAAAARQARLARNLADLNHPPVRVFSPYQMLKGMYQLKGYEALLSDYHDGLFVFDEIHAYEVRRLALILKTMEYLARHFNARFLVMSATFPTLIKDWLREVLNDPADIQADPALFAEFRRHRLSLLDGELLSEPALEHIARAARSGKSVLVVCNLVDRAQAVFRELRARLEPDGVHVELLHGRFNMRDRSAKERLVREAAGSTSQDRRSIVLVATQVVEVSLDIDLDTIYTDPAPLEALVQRFGRVNRRRKQTDLAPVHVYREPADGQVIYDPILIQRTLAILERENSQPLDENAIGDWLDEIYSGEIAARWQEAFDAEAREFEATCIRSLRPFEASEHLEELFYKAFDGTEVLPESLYQEFLELQEEDPIRAGELLVPITWGRYHALANEGRVLPRDRDMPYVVRASYDGEVGLTFDEWG